MKKLIAIVLLAAVSSTAFSKDITTIRFGVDPTFAPFESKSPQGTLEGFDIDLGNAICAQLKAKCVWVETSFDSIIPALKAGKFDAILSAMSINETRARQVTFSDKLYNSPTRLIAKAASALLPTAESLTGKTVGVAQGSTQEAYAKAKWAPNGVNVVSYTNQDLIYPELINGRIDATLTDAVVGDSGFLQTPRGKGYSFAGGPIRDKVLLGEGVGIGINKSNKQMIDAINLALRAIHENGTYDAIQKKYFSFDIYNG
ncbi:ABC transporter substrate-binding protein [Pseudomonas syringae]|nr:ABC transporter substrate-binding protein [Pseudomonas syringae]